MFKPHEIKWNQETISNLWNYYSKDKFFNSMYFTRVRGIYIVKYLNKKVNLRNKRVLDYGSGPGYLFENLLKLDIRAKYSALDFSEESIYLLKKKYGQEPLFDGAYFVDEPPENIKTKFDVVTCCEVIEHLDDKSLDLMLDQVRSLLGKGGYVCFTTPNDENLEEAKNLCPECGCIFHRWQHVRIWNKNSLNNFMKKQGFNTVSIEEVCFCDFKSKAKNILKWITSGKNQKPHLVYIGKLS